MTGADGANGNLPVWAKTVVAVGVVPAFAFWLLYIVTGVLADMRTDTATGHADILTEARGTLTEIRDHRRDDVQLVRLLELICRRLGTNTAEREACH